MRNENNDKRGERAAIYAGVGVAFMGSLGIVAIAAFAFLGVVVGMAAGFARRGKGGS